MNPVFDGMDTQLVLLVAAVAVVVLGFRLVFQVVKVGAGSILGLVAIVLGLQYLFGAPRKIQIFLGVAT